MRKTTTRLEVLKASTTECIWFHPEEGRPSATPSVAILDRFGNTITAANTTSVTQETANTTLSAGASEGDRSVTLTAATGFEYRGSYLLTNALGQWEWVRSRGVNTSTGVMTLDEALEFDHASGATIVGTAFYYTLDATETATLDYLYRAQATYTVDSIVYTTEVPFDVVRMKLQNPLTVEAIKECYPDVMPFEHGQTRGSDYADLRIRAWENVLNGVRDYDEARRPALLKAPSEIVKWAFAEFEFVAHKAGVPIVRDRETPTLEIRRQLLEELKTQKNTTLAGLTYIDLNDDNAVGKSEEDVKRADFIR